jgi:acetyltransferase
MDPSLKAFFHPEGIAIVGASNNPRKLGFTLTQNLIQSGYEGAIHLVNPKQGSFLEYPLIASIAEVPNPVDLAVLLIPAQFVPKALEECGHRGIRAAIIASGGFREIGKKGALLEEECLRIANDLNMRLIGPNCIGLIDSHLPLDTTFLPPPGPTPGDIAFISHSGAICAAVIDWARGQGFGLSSLVSLGNQVDVNETDVLPEVAADASTKVITLYLEGVSNGASFVKTAVEVAKDIPIVALKVGRFESGQKAVASHTGALAGEEAAYNAAFEKAGVIRAETTEELFDWARALAWCPPSQGRRVAILTNAGGPGVTAVDALEAQKLEVASLSFEAQKKLGEILPPAASLENPVDMLASATPQQYARCLEILIKDPNVDSCLVILPPPPIHSAGGVARALIPIIKTTEKPVVVSLMGERMIQEAVEHFRASKVPEYRFPERAASALAILAKRADWLMSREEIEVETGSFVKSSWIKKTRNQLADLRVGFLNDVQAFEIISEYGIQVPSFVLAANADHLLGISRKLKFPLVLKIQSDQIVHKSDVEGIQLGIQDEAELLAAYNAMMQIVAEQAPEAQIDGVLVQEMVSVGQEIIIGSKSDPQFGPLMMFGSGGIEVEGLKDLSFALAPLDSQSIESMLASTWAGKKLGGYRNIPSVNISAIEDAMIRLSQLVLDFPDIQEIEINPMIVNADAAFAVDARIKWSAEL